MNNILQLSQSHGISILALCQAVSLPRATYYRYHSETTDISDNLTLPANALFNEQRQTILDLLHSERFVDCTPYQVYYTLLDEGHYYGSVRTFYRLLAENEETQDRRNQRYHRTAVKPELIAEMPNQVWSWDITKLLSFQRQPTFSCMLLLIFIVVMLLVG